MSPEEKIITMCLAGIISKERGPEREACMKAIRVNYGSRIAGLVVDHLKI